MHIGFRTSGGRGEYEVVGSHSGYNALDLEGWNFSMRWPDGIVRDTGLWLDPAESGKARLRSMLTPQVQIGRIVAPMLLLPDPTRAYRNTPTTLPIAVAKQYSLTEVGFGAESEFSGVADLVTFVPSFVKIANQRHSDVVGVTARWARLVAVYAQAAVLPTTLQALVKSHQDFLASGDVVNQRLTTIVTNIDKQLALTRGITFVPNTDPLPALESLLGISPPAGPTLPPPDQLGEDAPDVSVRAAHQYRLTRIRGQAGRKFSESVREAYRHRCAFCGAKFGGIDSIRSGVDAAHILAWSKHDLDIVQNGIALCKLHHWAFDAGIMLPVKIGSEYVVRFTDRASRLDNVSRAQLGVDGQKIPREWLPAEASMRPSPKYLERLYADLGVVFAEDALMPD